jgi:hypothetical protein
MVREFVLGKIYGSDSPLASQYPTLYNIVRHKDVLVEDVLEQRQLNIGFTPLLTEDKWETWISLARKLMGVIRLADEADSLK